MEGTEIKEFKDLKFSTHPISYGLQCKVFFNNNYGVSIVKTEGSYGYPHLWEVAILYDGSLTYDSGITDGVLGHQSELDVINVINKVKALK